MSALLNARLHLDHQGQRYWRWDLVSITEPRPRSLAHGDARTRKAAEAMAEVARTLPVPVENVWLGLSGHTLAVRSQDHDALRACAAEYRRWAERNGWGISFQGINGKEVADV